MKQNHIILPILMTMILTSILLAGGFAYSESNSVLVTSFFVLASIAIGGFCYTWPILAKRIAELNKRMFDTMHPDSNRLQKALIFIGSISFILGILTTIKDNRIEGMLTVIAGLSLTHSSIQFILNPQPAELGDGGQ